MGPSVLSVAFLRVLCVKSEKHNQIGLTHTIAVHFPPPDEPKFLTATARLAMVPPMLQILNSPFSSAAVLVFSFQIIANLYATS